MMYRKKKMVTHAATAFIFVLLIFTSFTASSAFVSRSITTANDVVFPVIVQSIYTTNTNGSYQRVFKYETEFIVVAVVRNIGRETVSLSSDDITFSIVSENNETMHVEHPLEEYVIESGDYVCLRFSWSCPFDMARWEEAGFTFVGKKFFAQVSMPSSSQRHGFYIDEFGLPSWLRDAIFFVPPGEHDLVSSGRMTVDKLKEGYREIAEKAARFGIDCFHLGRLYQYGYHEGNQPSTINYWFPASDSPYATYSDPGSPYLSLADGNKSKAQDIIHDMVSVLHDEGMHVRAYSDPMGMYAPNPRYWNPLNPFYIQEYLKQGYVATAHHHASDPGWARFDEDGEVRRLRFFETRIMASDVHHLAVETCHAGPSKLGLQQYENSSIPGFDASDPDFDYGFHPGEIADDLDVSSQYDASWHYEQVKESLRFAANYGIDGLSPDDTGRLIMGLGKADYADDLWHHLIHPSMPTDARNMYGVCYCSYCTNLREQLRTDKDAFTLNALANMVKHMRWQAKYVSPDGFVMSSDYLLPSDVGWKSMVASEDVSTTDQFDIWKSSFARWAYQTFHLGYRHMRTDLRRTLLPGLGSQSMVGLSNREDLTTAIMIAASWANKVDVEVNDPSDCKILSLDERYWGSKEKLVANYFEMRQELPFLFSEVGPELLYHKKLRDPRVNVPGAYEYLWGDVCLTPRKEDEVDEPYAVLYSVPCEFGESMRMLHVMNSRVVSHLSDSMMVPADYCFKIRVPVGESVSSVRLVSPDFYRGSVDPDRDGRPDDSFAVDVTSREGDVDEDDNVWEDQGDYVVVKVPHVVAYSSVIVEFSDDPAVGHLSGFDEDDMSGNGWSGVDVVDSKRFFIETLK